MKTLKHFGSAGGVILLGLFMVTGPVQAAHRAILFNQNAMDKVLEMWPDLVESVNNQARGIENHGERGRITQSPLRAHLGQLLREQPTPAQYGDGFKMLVKDEYAPSGMTAFASRLNTNEQVTAYHYLLRMDGRLPIRFAYSLDLARQPIPTAAAAGFYENRGAMWDTMDSASPWLWLHGMSAEGDWDAPNRGCMGDDLAVKPGVEVHQVKGVLEICPDFNAATVQALVRGVKSGWRFAGVHGIGSNAIRLFVQKLEESMKANPALTLEYVRNSRHGFAHGTMTGAVPDVVAAMVKYNIFLPITLGRSLDIEPGNCQQNYVEDCYNFLGPIKTLLDAGVNVVGESYGESYFEDFDVFVNRTNLRGEHEGETIKPEEGVDRVVALKLFTYRSAEFMLAESKIGSLEVGKYADFIVTDKPFLSGPDAEIKNNKVLMNVLAGENRYQDAEFKPVVR